MNDLQIAEIIIEVVAKAGGLKDTRPLTGRRTHPHLVKLRDTARYLIRQQTGLSLPAIGKLFHQDHSSVHAAIAKEGERIRRGLKHPGTGLTWVEWHKKLLAIVDERLVEVSE